MVFAISSYYRHGVKRFLRVEYFRKSFPRSPGFVASTRSVASAAFSLRWFLSRVFVTSENGNFFSHRRRLCSCCVWPSDLPPATEWGYLKKDGPATWPLKYPDAGGLKQSPVDIQTSSARPSSDLKDRPLERNYGSQACKSVLNAGQGWRVDIREGVASLSGGPLEHKYELAQFHCHWGNADNCGSEHTIDGKSHVGELHFVHWNKDLYSKCSDAVRAPKGLCVIAVFLELGDSNPELQKLCDTLKSIPYRDQRVDMPNDFDLNLLFPDDHSYWSYDGSLTTPPCYESVSWIVLKQPITVSKSQVQSFRLLHTHSENEDVPPGEFKGKVQLNFRPPQDLNARIILDCSFN